ncbi:uncharacterized protein BJX67DRAFT_382150 [Aspergillus lucknowensis]|uniref:Uncharacterized protein n=1 Tax=Aspergillus lucknowensis TaxID=176173 RepID=A0ABR4LNC6_9EURO
MANANVGEEQALHNLCVSAFTAEYQRDYQNAASLHKSSVAQLSQALQKAGMLDHNKKSILRRKIKIHGGQLQNLNQQQPDLFLLVVPQSRKGMVEEQLSRGVATIGLEDMVLGKHRSDRAQNPHATIKPVFQYLLQQQVSPYTPTVRFFKATQLEIVGRLDPFFREFILASQSTRLLIMKYGH